MSNDEWIVTELELNEMLFVPAGDGAVPLRNSRRTTPILTAKWGSQKSATAGWRAPMRIARCASMRGSFVIPSRGAKPSA